MIFDSFILSAVAEELEQTVVGGKIERIYQPSPLEIVIRIYRQGETYQLLLSAHPEAARLHLTQITRENPLHPPVFCMLLRKYLEGAWVTEVSLPGGFAERVIYLTVQAHDRSSLTLVVETMGKHSNIILINQEKIILGSIKTVTRAISRVREIKPGVAYRLPPLQKEKQNPLNHVELANLEEPNGGQEEQWLLSNFSGISPLLAREIVQHSKLPHNAEALWYSLNELLMPVRTGDFNPHIWQDEKSNTTGIYPIPLVSLKVSTQNPIRSISEGLDKAAEYSEKHSALQYAHDALVAALHKAIKSKEHEKEQKEKGIANSEKADQYQQAGELIQAQQGKIVSGGSSITVPDYYTAPMPDGSLTNRTITLDPAIDLKSNAARYFKKARKARESKAILEKRKTELIWEISVLIQAEKDALTADSLPIIAEIRERVAASLHNPQRQLSDNRNEKQTSRFEGYKIKVTRSPDGWEILVGENSTSNDYLTTKLASPSDIWLHVRAGASAHGIIRSEGKPAAVSPAALQQAAEMVAARSEVKHSSLIPVDYTLKKYVRKPRKSAPGAVTYQNEKTIYVNGI